MNIFTDGALSVSLAHYLILSILLFTTGFIVLISNGNLLKSLAGIMIIFNAIVLNFALSNAYMTDANSLIASTEAAKSSLVSSFAPLENILLNFDAAAGDSTAFYILILGLIELVIGAIVVFCAYSKFKTTEADAFCELKSDENKKDGEF